MHKKISYTMRNFAWCVEFIFDCILWFRTVCEIVLHSVLQLLLLLISHRHAKLLHVGFLPLVFFLASLIGLVTDCQAWKRAMKCSKTRILHVFELQLPLPWIAQNSPSFFACFNDKKATKNTKTCQKLISNPYWFLNVPIELKNINYYSKVFKTVNFKL